MRETYSISVPSVIGYCLVALLAGCSSADAPSTIHDMGEQVQLGRVIYTVLDVEWMSELPTDDAPRTPQHRFAVIRLNIKNESNDAVDIPLLTLEDADGKSTAELSDATGLDSWLGLIRSIPPAGADQGRIVFDVEPGEYRLRVTDGASPETERTALVRIPLRLRQEPALPNLQTKQPGEDLTQ